DPAPCLPARRGPLRIRRRPGPAMPRDGMARARPPRWLGANASALAGSNEASLRRSQPARGGPALRPALHGPREVDLFRDKSRTDLVKAADGRGYRGDERLPGADFGGALPGSLPSPRELYSTGMRRVMSAEGVGASL